MVGAALIQLVALGIQDIYLTGNPQITFWKVVYRRYTHFARELIELQFTGQVGFGKQLTATISRNGDLIGNTYFVFRLPAIEPNTAQGSCGVYWSNAIGHVLLQKVDFLIGGQVIDSQYGEWMEIWNELSETFEHDYSELTGKRYTVQQLKQDAAQNRTYYVPLQFWYCKNPGLALPLIALQYHEVKIQVHTRPLDQCWVSEGNPLARPLKRGANCQINDNDLEASLYVQYVYLDGEERARFAQSSHEYLITQLQTSGPCSSALAGVGAAQVPLNFNHPVKEIEFTVQQECKIQEKNYFDYSGLNGDDPVLVVDLKLNNHSRFCPREGRWFRLGEPLEQHTRIPDKHIYSYGFGLDAEKMQPNGTLNFSRIDNAVLILTLQRNIGIVCIQVWALNYNVLRILAGMGGLAYSN
jgi:hypothetical protein